MEARQLALFLAACQHLNHATASAETKVSASAISQAVSGLEQELGVALFFRGPLGHIPTEAARWLYQLAETLLQLLEAAVHPTVADKADTLQVISPLQFMFGRLSRMAALASRELCLEHGGVRVRTAFASPFNDVDKLVRNGQADIVMSYGDTEGDSPFHLYDDDWVVVRNREEAAPLTALLLPPLSISYRPPLTLRQLRCFDAVPGLENMTEAAQQLHVAQPALSVQLRNLEMTVGEPLFIRHRHGMVPAPRAGRRIALLSSDRHCEPDPARLQAGQWRAERRHG